MNDVTVRQDGLVTRDMAAQLCGVDRDTISAWVRRGHLGIAHREGRRVFFNLVEVAKVDHLLRKRARRPAVPLPSWTLDGEPDVDMRDFVLACAAAGQEQAGRFREGLVYYILFGSRIKIGTCGSMRNRIDSLPRGVHVLATEPGGHDVERMRHEQFADCRTGGEWFRPTRPLLRHVANLALRESDV